MAVAFIAVLSSSGWRWGTVPSAGTLAMASGATFAAIALGQMANAFACRSDTVPVWRLVIRDNLFIVVAVAAELLLLAVFLGVTPLTQLLGGSPPPTVGWICAFGAASMVIVADAAHKYVRRRRLSRQDQ